MSDDGLDVVLGDLKHDLSEAQSELQADINQANETANRLNVLEMRLARLSGSSAHPDLPHPTQQISATDAHPDYPNQADRQAPTWEEIRQMAETNLRQRGLDPAQIELATLLEPAEVRRIERRFRGGFRIQAHLDRYDLATAVVAGLMAGLVDFLVVKIPKDVLYLGQYAQSATPLAKIWDKLNVSDDNWLSRYCKTAFDEVGQASGQISGFGARTHRLQTFGHDPLFGLVIGTIDIMRGGMTAISREGKIIGLFNTGLADHNPLTAFVRQILHLFSDGFTKMGLPAPGWSVLQLMQFGSFGEKERTVAELARYMYLKGYDSRHFLTMSTSVAAAEVVLRGYIPIRRKLDSNFDAEYEQAVQVANAHGLGDHPKFQAMALTAHLVAIGINAGKVAIYHGNPLAINYAEWLRFIQTALGYANTVLRSPTEALIGQAYANWRAIETGWPTMDVTAPEFPSLIVQQVDG